MKNFVVKIVEETPLDFSGPIPSERQSARDLLGNHHTIGLRDRLTNKLPVDAGHVEASHIDNLGINTGFVGNFNRSLHHHRCREYCTCRTRPDNSRLPERNAIIAIILGHQALALVEFDMLDNCHRIVRPERAVHQTDIVKGIGW